MGKKELLVTQVKKAFLELLEQKDTQVYLASQEIKVTKVDQWPIFLSLQTKYLSTVFHHLIYANVCRFHWPEGSLWFTWTKRTKGYPRNTRYSTRL